MPGPHVLTPPPNHATSVRHYCPLCAATGYVGSDKLTSLPSPWERGRVVAISVIATHMLFSATPVTLGRGRASDFSRCTLR